MSKSTDSIVYISDAYTETDDYKSRASSQKNLFDKRKSSRTDIAHIKKQLSSSRLRQQRELKLRIESREGTYYEISENTSNEDVAEAATTQSGFKVLPMPKKYLIFCFCCGIIAAGSVVVAAVVSTRGTALVPCAPSSDQPPYQWQCANATEFDEPWRLDHDGNDLKVNNNSYACDLREDVGWFKFSGEGGNKILSKCPKWKSCGTFAPMWTDMAPPDTVGVISLVTAYTAHGDNCRHNSVLLAVLRCSWDNPADLIYKYDGFYHKTCSTAFCGMF